MSNKTNGGEDGCLLMSVQDLSHKQGRREMLGKDALQMENLRGAGLCKGGGPERAQWGRRVS